MSGGLFEWAASRVPREGRPGDLLEQARRGGVLSALDQQFADRLCALYRETDDGVRWAAALACRQESMGHVCADLPRLATSGLVLESEEDAEAEAFPVLATHPTLAAWRAALAASRLVARVAGVSGASRADQGDDLGGAGRPLVLDERGRLYLRRLYRAEALLARSIARRVARPDLPLGDFEGARAIEVVLADRVGDGDDAPRRALAVGLARPLTILTGGPGTGKTTLVARLVRLLGQQALATQGRPPRVVLLAPTGKAAAAMAASFARERAVAGLDGAIREALPMAAETIHRALARSAGRGRSGRRADAVSDADVVVVDEASMVDLEQMDRLFGVCEQVPRLVLLGDPRQLASVEAGAVLAELCGDDDAGAPLRDLERSIVRLERSHRYAEAGGIGRLAEAVRAGDAELALAILDDPRHAEVERVELGSAGALAARLAAEVEGLEAAVSAARSPAEKLARLADYRVLCAHRRGSFGVEALARALDAVAARARQTSARSLEWPGRLLLVTRNAPEQALWNGDVGLVDREREGGALRVLFPGSDGGVRSLSLARLPAHESAIAMSVHKSQGSEFGMVDLVLAPRPSRLMTRELLYTGITRARERLRVHASAEVLRAAIARRARRDSGLADRLRELE